LREEAFKEEEAEAIEPRLEVILMLGVGIVAGIVRYGVGGKVGLGARCDRRGSKIKYKKSRSEKYKRREG